MQEHQQACCTLTPQPVLPGIVSLTSDMLYLPGAWETAELGEMTHPETGVNIFAANLVKGPK